MKDSAVAPEAADVDKVLTEALARAEYFKKHGTQGEELLRAAYRLAEAMMLLFRLPRTVEGSDSHIYSFDPLLGEISVKRMESLGYLYPEVQGRVPDARACRNFIKDAGDIIRSQRIQNK